MDKELHIFPCADTLLYLPVYLAIDIQRTSYKFGFKEVKDPDPEGSVTWKYDSLLIVLHPASGGDNKAILAIEKHQQTNPSHWCIAIADPMHTINDGIKNENLRIVATFINRIALCSIFKEPIPKRGNRAVYWKYIQDLQNKISTYGRLMGGDFDNYRQQLNHLSIAFCEDGETNKALLRYFLGVDRSAVPVNGFGTPEFEVVANGQSSVSFTTAPWLRQACKLLFQLGDDEIHVGHWLPSVPYPFSSIITTKESWELEAAEQWKGPLGRLIRHMMVASAMLSRYRDMLITGLDREAHHFRYFGLPRGCTTEHHNIILDAIRHLVERDYMAEYPENPWVGWDFASDVITPKSKTRLNWSNIYAQYTNVVEREKEVGFWRTLADDEEFWKSDFRLSMSEYLKANPPGREVSVRFYE